MKTLVKKIFTTMVAIAFAAVACGRGAYAEDVDMSNIVGGFTVSPPNQVITLVPGETYDYSIEVFNPAAATESIDIKAYLKSFGVDKNSEDYDFDFDTVSNYNQILDWIKIENTEATIEPNKRAFIKYTISVPEDAPAGGQYASIAIQRVPKQTENKGGAAISEAMEIASLIYATVLGETTESGAILENNIPVFSFEPRVKADTLVQNTGNVHSGAKFTLQVFPLFSDEEVYTNEEKPDSIVVIPGQTYRSFEQWDGPTVGIFKVVHTVEFAGQVSKAEKFVIVCPLWLLFVIVAAVIFILIWIFARNKKRKNR